MKSSRAIPWAIGLAIIIAALSGSVYFLITRVPGDTADEVLETVDKAADVAIDKTRDVKNLAREIASDIKNGLQINPRITVGKTIITEGNREITEVATKEKLFTHIYSWEHTWTGSTKRLKLMGTFRGKAGYDLSGKLDSPTNPWGIDISEDGQVISAILPAPTILSVEMTGYEIVEDEGGYWNKVSKEDRQSAVNSLQREARKELANTNLLQEADDAFLHQIEDAARKSAPSGFKVIRPKLP